MILQILFWVSVFLIFHSYVLYTLILKILVKGKEENALVYSPADALPHVSVLMAAHNEEAVIHDKIRSIYRTQYPLNRLEVLIGSDNSTDKTAKICKLYSWNYKSFRFFEYKRRQGKAPIINKLAREAAGEILIITDANVMFMQTTIYELVKHFKNEKTGLVDTIMMHTGLDPAGISMPENAYISREVLNKQREGMIWGTMMGPFGGCYAIRREDFPVIPANALVDDFYVNMKILEKGKNSLNSSSAFVTEDVSNDLGIEFRRKIRIATGNFQNLRLFFHLLFKRKKGLAFSFISHKILRWAGPFILITAFITNLLLFRIPLYRILFFIQVFFLILAVIDSFLKKFSLHIVPLRFITHFLSMNLALLIGFIKFIRGVKSGIWQPTIRNQSERD